MSTDGWIKKCGIYIPWTLPTLQKKEILPVHNNTVKLRDVMLNEISRSQKITVWLIAWVHLYGVSKIVKGFPGAPDDKESACNMGDLGSIPGLGRTPGEGNGYPLQYSCLENSMDRGYSPWGHKELDTTEWLHFHNKIAKLTEIKWW